MPGCVFLLDGGRVMVSAAAAPAAAAWPARARAGRRRAARSRRPPRTSRCRPTPRRFASCSFDYFFVVQQSLVQYNFHTGLV